MRRTTLTLLVAAAAALGSPVAAQAAMGTVEVAVSGPGSVLHDSPGPEQIHCGSDCSGTWYWRDLDDPPSARLLTVQERGGFGVRWSGCAPVAGRPGECDVQLIDGAPANVTAAFVDTERPTVSIDGFEPEPYGGARRPRIDLVPAVADNDRVARVELLLGGKVVATDDASPFDLSAAVRDVPTGSHVLQVRASDAAGNVGESATRFVRVDNHAPDLVVTDGPREGQTLRDPRLAWSFSASDGTVTCSVVAAAATQDGFRPCTDAGSHVVDAPADGRYRFAVRATDELGNATTAVATVGVDRQAPAASGLSGPADGATVADGVVAYGWTAEDAGGLASQTCRWDDGPAEACDGSSRRALAPRRHTFRLALVDLAGNRSELERAVVVAPVPASDDGRTGEGGPPPEAGGGVLGVHVPARDPGPVITPATTSPAALQLRLSAPATVSRRALRRSGLVVRVRCSSACSGSVRLRAGSVTTTGRFSRGAAGTQAVTLRLGHKARATLRRGGKLRLRAESAGAVAVGVVRVR